MPVEDLIQIRGGTAAEWATADPVLAEREMGLETDTRIFKFGDGSTAWSALPNPDDTGTAFNGEFGTGVTATGDGAAAFGSGTDGGTIFASAAGALASGYTVGGGVVRASDYGSFASGYAADADSLVEASGTGAVAFGYAHDGGVITAVFNGSLAGGYVENAGSVIQTFGKGATALGYAKGGGVIAASSKGALAAGFTTADPITASAYGAIQFNPGVNAQANSLAVGADMRINGGGAPGTPRNGDIWQASNYVYIRSNSNSVKVI